MSPRSSRFNLRSPLELRNSKQLEFRQHKYPALKATLPSYPLFNLGMEFDYWDFVDEASRTLRTSTKDRIRFPELDITISGDGEEGVRPAMPRGSTLKLGNHVVHYERVNL